MLSVFLREPQFQGQTKEKLTSPHATRLVEPTVRDHFDHWLSAAPAIPDTLLHVVERAEQRLRRRRDKQVKRQSAVRKLGFPASSPTAPARAPTAPSCSSSRGTPLGDQRSRRATARTKRCCRCAARS